MNEYVGFVRKIGLVGVTNFLIGIGSIIILIIITKNFTVQEYGIWVQVTVTIGLIPYIATLGLSDSMIRFLAALTDKKKIKEEFYSIVFVGIMFSLFVSFLLFLFSGVIAERLFDENTIIALILPLIIIIVSLDNLLLSFFRTFQQMKRYSIFMLLQSYILIVIVAYCAFYKYSIVTAIIGILISYVIIFLMMLILIISTIGFKFPEFKNLREYLSFGLPNIPSNLSLWILDSSDRYLIGILLGISFVGYYSPSYAIGNIITIFASPLYVILFPVLSKYYDKNEKNKVNVTLRYTLKYYMAASIPSFFILSILSKQILQILTTTQIAFEGYLITPFAALSTLLIGICIIISQIILLEKKTKLIGFIWVVAAVLNIGLNVIIIPIFGILGAGLVTLISYTVASVLLFYYSRKYIVFNMDLRFILKSVLSSVIASIIVVMFYPSTVLNTGIIIFSFFVVYAGVLIILKGIRRNELQFFKNLVFS